jgi:ABC-type branched-subunit amino acid transport system substrate-binding protein
VTLARRTAWARCFAVVALIVWVAGCSVRREELPLPYRQAEDAFRLGDYERSAAAYRAYLKVAEEKDLIPKAYYKLALAEFRRGRYTECLAALDELDAEMPDRHWVRVYELRADAEQGRGNVVSSIRWWEMAWIDSDTEHRVELERRIRQAVAELPPSALPSVRAIVQTPEIQALVDAHGRASAAAGPVRSKGPAFSATPAAEAAEPGPAPENLRIGCLLPLSGSYAVYGERSLKGIRLALGANAARLDARDTQGQPERASAMLDQLIADPNVVAVVGPLRSKEAEVVALRAERAGMPLVLLSQREVQAGRFLFQPVMTYERQAAQLAEYATSIMKLRNIGVLYPRDEYGSGLAQAFERELTKRGARVGGMLAYEPGAHEFQVEVLTVQKWVSDDGLQAVFIPDFATTAVELGKLLRQAHPTLTLLGSNGWNDPARLAPAGEDLDGAVFVDGFFSASTRPATQACVSAYQKAYGAVPEILEAQAHDAAMLVEKALEAGAISRTQIGPALASVRTFDGAAGTIGIGPDGLQHELFLLRLARGSINELAPVSLPRPGPGPRPEVAPAPELQGLAR